MFCQPVGRDAALHECREHPVPERLAENALLFPAPGRYVDPVFEQGETAVSFETFHEKQVFHQPQVRKTSKLFEHRTSDKDTLIAVGPCPPFDPLRIAPFQQARRRRTR